MHDSVFGRHFGEGSRDRERERSRLGEQHRPQSDRWNGEAQSPEDEGGEAAGDGQGDQPGGENVPEDAPVDVVT